MGQAFFHMDDSVELILFLSGVGTSKEALRLLCSTASCVPYHKRYIRDPIILLVRSKGSPPRTNDLTRPPVAATAKKIWSLPETAIGLLCNCLMSALSHTLHDPIILLVRSKGSPPRTNDLTRPPVAATAKKY